VSRAVLVVAYPNGTVSTEFLSATNAVAWADRMAQDDRASSIRVVFDDLTVSTFK
jgi:hypothetical protein